MVEGHGAAKLRQLTPLRRGLAAVPLRLGHEPRLVEQLVALQHLFLVPLRADAEAYFQPLGAPERPGGLIGGSSAARSAQALSRGSISWVRISGLPWRQSSQGK